MTANTSLPNPVHLRLILLTQLLDYSFTVTYFLEWLWKSVFLVCLIRDLYVIDVAYRTKL